MATVRELLNELKWKQGVNFEKTEIWYVHRGAPDDTMIITGKDIVSLGRSFIETTTAMIPYHRVFKVLYEGKPIFER